MVRWSANSLPIPARLVQKGAQLLWFFGDYHFGLRDQAPSRLEVTGQVDASPHVISEARADDFWRQVGQRDQHETALPHPRVWHLEVREVNGEVADKQDVDVESPCPPSLGSFPPGRRFGPPGHVEQLQGCRRSP